MAPLYGARRPEEAGCFTATSSDLIWDFFFCCHLLKRAAGATMHSRRRKKSSLLGRPAQSGEFTE
jgi:hypothetical protein